jgi:hypothetical protein
LYFVACETTTTLATLISRIASALCIPLTSRSADLMDVVLSLLRDKGKLILYFMITFETVWEDEETRHDMEDFLSQVNHSSQLAIFFTMRAIQPPLKVAWSPES